MLPMVGWLRFAEGTRQNSEEKEGGSDVLLSTNPLDEELVWWQSALERDGGC